MPTELSCDKLRSLTNDEFRRIVDADIRNQSSDGDAECLRTDEIVLDRWYTTLVAMKKSVEHQFAAREAECKALRAELESRGDHDGSRDALVNHLRWKAGVIRFKTGLEEKLSDAAWRRRAITGAGRAEMLRRERNDLSQRALLLEAALSQVIEQIEEHRAGLGDDDDYSQADIDLWGLAQQIRERLVNPA